MLQLRQSVLLHGQQRKVLQFRQTLLQRRHERRMLQFGQSLLQYRQDGCMLQQGSGVLQWAVLQGWTLTKPAVLGRKVLKLTWDFRIFGLRHLRILEIKDNLCQSEKPPIQKSLNP